MQKQIIPVDMQGSPELRSQRGVALMLAIMIIAMMVVFSVDMIVSSRVQIEKTNRVKELFAAEYLAKSGQEIAQVLIGVDTLVDSVLSSDVVGPLKQDAKDTPGDIWAMFNILPGLGGDDPIVEAFVTEELGISEVQQDDLILQLRELGGRFTVEVIDESNKINLNYLAKGRGLEVEKMFLALMGCPAEADFLESKRLDATELFYLIKDYVDEDEVAEQKSGFNDESLPYSKMTPPRTVKNAPFESVDELKMIPGWDEEMHAVFAPYFTVFPFKTDGQTKLELNLNTLPKAVLRCFFPNGEIDCKDTYEESLSQAQTGSALAGSKSEIAETLKSTFCANEEEDKDKAQWFGVQSSTFRVRTSGFVGDSEKELEVVYVRDTGGGAATTSRPLISSVYWKNHR